MILGEKTVFLATEDHLQPPCPLPALYATSVRLIWVSMHTVPFQHTESYDKDNFALAISAAAKVVSGVRLD